MEFFFLLFAQIDQKAVPLPQSQKVFRDFASLSVWYVCAWLAGDWVWDLLVSVGEISGWGEASVAQSSGCGISPQTVCAASFVTVSSFKKTTQIFSYRVWKLTVFFSYFSLKKYSWFCTITFIKPFCDSGCLTVSQSAVWPNETWQSLKCPFFFLSNTTPHCCDLTLLFSVSVRSASLMTWSSTPLKCSETLSMPWDPSSSPSSSFPMRETWLLSARQLVSWLSCPYLEFLLMSRRCVQMGLKFRFTALIPPYLIPLRLLL